MSAAIARRLQLSEASRSSSSCSAPSGEHGGTVGSRIPTASCRTGRTTTGAARCRRTTRRTGVALAWPIFAVARTQLMPSTRSCSWPSEPRFTSHRGAPSMRSPSTARRRGPSFACVRATWSRSCSRTRTSSRESRSTGTASTCRTRRTGSPALRRTPSYRARAYTYRFRAEQDGTFWYHTHQVSSEDVRRGLFGALVVEPRTGPAAKVDMAVAVHTFAGVPTLAGRDDVTRRAVAPGTHVRMRLINTDSSQQRLDVTGTPFRVLAIDGTDVSEPGLLENVELVIAGGGRIDVGFTQPRNGVRVGIEGENGGDRAAAQRCCRHPS